MKSFIVIIDFVTTDGDIYRDIVYRVSASSYEEAESLVHRKVLFTPSIDEVTEISILDIDKLPDFTSTY
jgi:hypothetical protein